jgi:hypothetical protein
MSKLIRLLLPVLLLSACGPETPQTSPKPSPSPSVKATSVPVLEATPTPTPEPTTSPFPLGTPQPSATPLPTPTPVFSTPTSEDGVEVQLNFKARVITAAREVLPVVENEFTLNPYALSEVKASLAIRNNVEAMPVQPRESDARYQVDEKVCTSSGCSIESRVDSTAYQKDLNTYKTTILPEWEARAYKGLAQELARLSAGRSSLKFTTDKNGEATLRLRTGKWYFSGRYTYGQGNAVVWEDVLFDVKATTKAIEMTR